MSLTNLTPHPIRVYGWEVPDTFELGEHEPVLELPPSGQVARIGEVDLGATRLPGCDFPVELVEYRHFNGLPAAAADPGERHHTWYAVSLALALACSKRGDLLVPYREIRNSAGTVIGCRSLAVPV